jgi:hypothetical protein
MASLLQVRRPCISLDQIQASLRHSNPQLLQHSRHTLTQPKAFATLIEATIDATTAATTFEPRVDPTIAIAAAVAAAPPILFWIRIALNERRRRKEAEEKEMAREELKRKLFGDK